MKNQADGDDAHLLQAAQRPCGVEGKSQERQCINQDQVDAARQSARQHEDKQGEKVLRSERYYGKTYRAFSLAQDVDEASAQAKYNEGVLELRLPKKAAVTSKKLAIQ